jgi:acyl-CoA reductase-like NAD-dependent aldehyde dehydrogenase
MPGESGQVEDTVAGVQTLVDRARAASQPWAALPPERRRPRLVALRRAVLDAGDRICATVQSETGKPAAAVMLAEVMHAAAHADYCARMAGRALRTRRVSPRPLYHKSAWLAYRPRGVAGVIAPANYPFLLPFLATASALAAGCSVVLKPSELAPRSGRLVAAVAGAAGFEGLVQVVVGQADHGQAGRPRQDLRGPALHGRRSDGGRTQRTPDRLQRRPARRQCARGLRRWRVR